MKVKRLEIQNFRSIRDLTLPELGDYVVFYGPNGGGKSNVLAALDLLPRAVIRCRDAAANLPALLNQVPGGPSLLRHDELRRGAGPAEALVLRATVEHQGNTRTLAVRLPLDRSDGSATIAPEDVAMAQQMTAGFQLVRAIRDTGARRASGPPDLAAHLREGRLEEALFYAQSTPDAGVRHRFKLLKQLLQGPPLGRQDFDAVQYPDGTLGIRENLNARGQDLPLDLAGLGIVQVYLILAQLLLPGPAIAAIEEPEAHLHAPTTGRALRALIASLVLDDRSPLEQIFIATHSNLFDLDRSGFWDIRRDADGCTVANRKPLSELYAEHLYEPGPARHALREMMTYLPADTVAFVAADGQAWTAEQMVQRLDEDDDIALDFVRQMHDAAVRSVRAASRRRQSPA